jgi:type 1 glutamine amidotransferase
MHMQPDAKILATAYDDPAFNGTGKEEPILWTVTYGKGRVFHKTLGHDVEAMEQPAFLIPFVRGTEWAAYGR